MLLQGHIFKVRIKTESFSGRAKASVPGNHTPNHTILLLHSTTTKNYRLDSAVQTQRLTGNAVVYCKSVTTSIALKAMPHCYEIS